MMCSLFIIASSWRSESYRQTKRFRLTFYIRSSSRQLPLGHLLCPAFRIVCISYDHPFPVSLLCYYRSSWLLLLLLLLFSSKKKSPDRRSKGMLLHYNLHETPDPTLTLLYTIFDRKSTLFLYFPLTNGIPFTYLV